VEDANNFGLDGLFVLYPVWCGDSDNSGAIDAADFMAFWGCLSGPDDASAEECTWADMDVDGGVDLRDFRAFQPAYNGS
jgi:hypothetical protein